MDRRREVHGGGKRAERYRRMLATAEYRLTMMGEGDIYEAGLGVTYTRRMMENMRDVALEGLNGPVQSDSEEKHSVPSQPISVFCKGAHAHELDADEREFYEVTGKIICKQCILGGTRT